MATERKTTSVAAASTSSNILAGTQFEYIEGPAIVSIWASAENYAQMVVNFKVGGLSICEDAVPNTETAAGIVDRQRDLLVQAQFIPPGRHLCRLTGTNSDPANAERLNTLVQIDTP